MEFKSKWVKSETLLDDNNGQPKPGGPLKPRVDAIQDRIEKQIAALEKLHDEQKLRDEEMTKKLVTSIKENNAQYSTVLSADLIKARKVSRVVSLSAVALEKLRTKLASISDFGDLVIILSPAMAVVKNLRSSLTPYVPEMESELGIIAELLSGILVDAGQVGGYTINFETANEEAVRLIEEAAQFVEQKMKAEFPDIPELPLLSSKDTA